jgi:hypothetical protein
MDGILSIEGFDQSLAEGVMLLTPFAADATDEMTVNFVTAYNAEFGVTPSQFAADNYDAVYALYNASKNAGIDASTSAEDACEKLIEQFKSFEFTGLTGTMSWNEDGSVTKTPKAVVIKGAVVAASKIKDDAKEYAFLYKHDGSGAQGDDIYFNVTVGGKDYTFVVESDFFGKDSEIYKAVEALKIGDKIDIGGFLYWYNAPQVQVTSVAASK